MRVNLHLDGFVRRTNGIEQVYCAVPVRNVGGAAVLRVAEPLDLIRRLDGALLRLSLSIVFVVVVASLIAVWWVAGRITQRVSDLGMGKS